MGAKNTLYKYAMELVMKKNIVLSIFNLFLLACRSKLRTKIYSMNIHKPDSKVLNTSVIAAPSPAPLIALTDTV